MKRENFFSRFAVLTVILFLIISCSRKNEAPFFVKDNLFDYREPNTLGLERVPGSETFTVFKPEENSDKYSHGAVIISFKNEYFVQWQSSDVDEDAPDTKVVYSRSPDLKKWSVPCVISEAREKGVSTSGGWWSDGNTLIAYINVWPEQEPKGGYTDFRTSEDGINWSGQESLLRWDGRPVNGIIEQDTRALPGGRIITSVHEQPGLVVSPYYTDNPGGTNGWRKGKMENLPFNGHVSRELEPSWFLRGDGKIVMIFRDQKSSFSKLASMSDDRGETWSVPVLTNMPDSRSKQCAGNLFDGTAFMINNPNNNKSRIPLVITLSRDGKYFNRAYLLRGGGDDLQPMRFEGKYKREGYSYPKACVGKEYLYVAYATNKEDVEITRIPVKALIAD